MTDALRGLLEEQVALIKAFYSASEADERSDLERKLMVLAISADAALLEHDEAIRKASEMHSLSPRELEILKLIATGQMNKEIATGLRLSEKTVKNHTTRIFEKLRVASRSAAVIVGLQRGIIRAHDIKIRETIKYDADA